MKTSTIKFRTSIFLSLAIIGSLFLTSCEKEIEVDLPEYETKTVIEGTIELGEPAMVTITRSTDYFAHYDSETLSRMFINNAIVTLTDNFGHSETLTFGFDDSQPLPFVYRGSTILGQTGGIYTLTVKVEDKEYTATTSILPTVPIDTIFFVEQDQDVHSGIIRIKFTDPAGVYNYYRIFSKVLGRDNAFLPSWGSSTFDDRLIEGISSNGDVYRGSSSNLMQDTTQNEGMMRSDYFMPGDTVVVKWCSIDYNTYKFWYSAEMEIMTGGNPFMTPAPIISNIPNALGVWSGYGTRIDTIVIPAGSRK